jgi:catechol 2,3-dioxygenase-like lactoylglutathione lyase family enzyme
MNSTTMPPATKNFESGPINMAIEVVVIPVSDVDRAKEFYRTLGWRLDLDFKADDGYRVIQFTPPGSGCSVIFGRNVTVAAPGSAQGLHLIVSNIEAVRNELIRRGIAISEPFHDAGGVFHHADAKCKVSGLNPTRQSYASYASFRDPDGNGWLLQEVTARLSANLKPTDTRFTRQVLEAIFGASATRVSA